MLPIIIYVEEDDIKIDEGSFVAATIYGLDKQIDVKGKDTNPTTMKGMFINKKVKGDDYVNWEWNRNCNSNCGADPVANVTPCPCEDGNQIDCINL